MRAYFVFVLSVRANKELLLNPVTITRNQYESVLIEPSINSTRVSVKIKKMDELEKILAHKFTRFLMQRADHFVILRRRPIAVCFINICKNTRTLLLLL